MCGIAGLFRVHVAVEEQEVTLFTDSLHHRGPDGSGVKMFSSGGIGHRRLSIIDLSSGAQPMTNETADVWVTFNGELYNYTSLRAELIQKGHVFVTESDTEVLVHGYEEWGEALPQRLRGMFAFALVDVKRGQVFMARDHLGIKPLQYYFDGKTFAFASELGAFHKIKGCTLTLDLLAIDNYLQFQYIPAPQTIWKEVKKLPPAHTLIYHFNGKLNDAKSYWRPDYSNKKIRTAAEWQEAAEEVISNSVKAHLISDVPFGAFLSGGIDSTLVVNYMSQLLKEPVKTFSIGFEEAEFNELDFALEASKKFGTQHYTEIVKPDALAVLSELVRHYGEPYGDSSAIPTYYVCALARKHVTMVLSGDGGDEAFAGYGSYVNWLKFQAINYRTGWKKKVFPLLQQVWPARYPATDTYRHWINKIHYYSNEQRQALWKNEYSDYFQNDSKLFEEIFKQSNNYSLSNKAQFADTLTYLPNDILMKVDIASMIHSLEVRTPFIDKEVWEFAASIPEEFLIGPNQFGVWEGKKILKNIIRKKFGTAFTDRRKMGFAVPLKKWFAPQGELHETLQDYILSGDSQVLHYFNRGVIQDMVQQERSGHLWLLLFLEEWLRQQRNR